MENSEPSGAVTLIFVVFAFVVYFLPTIIAKMREHYNQNAILLLNLILGWTGIGWVIALIWAVMNPPPKSSSRA
jgi:hypothetical protein